MQIADRYVVHEQRIAGSPQLRIVIPKYLYITVGGKSITMGRKPITAEEKSKTAGFSIRIPCRNKRFESGVSQVLTLLDSLPPSTPRRHEIAPNLLSIAILAQLQYYNQASSSTNS